MVDKVTVTLPDGSTIERTEPTIKARTSTKLLGGGLAGIALSGLALIPFYDEANALILRACSSDDGPLIFLGGMGVMLVQSYITARKTKSPIVPGKL